MGLTHIKISFIIKIIGKIQSDIIKQYNVLLFIKIKSVKFINNSKNRKIANKKITTTMVSKILYRLNLLLLLAIPINGIINKALINIVDNKRIEFIF